jgi:hypothetical protein
VKIKRNDFVSGGAYRALIMTDSSDGELRVYLSQGSDRATLETAGIGGICLKPDELSDLIAALEAARLLIEKEGLI